MTEWRKQRIDHICAVSKGKTGIAKAIPGKYPLVTTGYNRKTCNEYQLDAKAVCIPLVSSTGHGKKTLNYVHYQEGKFALGTILAAIIPKNDNELNTKYLYLFLSFYKDDILVPLMKGAANVSLSIRDIKEIFIPVPSINVQKNIVNKYYLVKPINEKLLKDLNDQVNYLEKLRQAILQEAIEGKLTTDWRKKHPDLVSGEHSAKNLLKKIKEEKGRLIRENIIKKQKPLPSVSEEEKPFELPEGWTWCRLGEFVILSENINIHSNFPQDTLINYVDLDCIDNKRYFLKEIKNKKISELSSRARRVLQKGYIAYSLVRPYLNNICIIDEDMENFIGSTGFCVFKPIKLEIKYIFYFLLSNYISELFSEKIKGFNSPSISINTFLNTPTPIPSLIEQKKIVNAIDMFMGKIKKLEKQCQERKILTDQLTQSLLREAFEQSK